MKEVKCRKCGRMIKNKDEKSFVLFEKVVPNIELETIKNNIISKRSKKSKLIVCMDCYKKYRRDGE